MIHDCCAWLPSSFPTVVFTVLYFTWWHTDSWFPGIPYDTIRHHGQSRTFCLSRQSTVRVLCCPAVPRRQPATCDVVACCRTSSVNQKKGHVDFPIHNGQVTPSVETGPRSTISYRDPFAPPLAHSHHKKNSLSSLFFFFSFKQP
jgi:hypothetical protein